jgi:hypothetical protein
MGKASRGPHPSYPPSPPPPKPDDAVIAAGQAIRYERNFHGGRGVVLDIENRGPGVVVVAGVRLPAGTTVPYHVADNTHRFTLELDAPGREARVRLAVKAWQPPVPRRKVLAQRSQIERDARTQVITAITKSKVWVDA